MNSGGIHVPVTEEDEPEVASLPDSATVSEVPNSELSSLLRRLGLTDTEISNALGRIRAEIANSYNNPHLAPGIAVNFLAEDYIGPQIHQYGGVVKGFVRDCMSRNRPN